MSAPSLASLPPFFTLTTGMTVRLTALHPTSGAVVTGVSTSNMGLSVDQEDATDEGSNVPVSGAFLPGG